MKKYFQKTKDYSPIRFVIELSFVAIIGKILVGFLIGLFIAFLDLDIREISTPNYNEISDSFILFLWLCIFAPIVETVIFQWIPIALLQKFTDKTLFIVGIDAALFTFAHFWNYNLSYILVVAPLAIILAWSFILHSKNSILQAFWITASIHALINFSSFLPIILL